MDKAEIFKLVAETAALSPATKRKVGAVILSDITDAVVSRGYNHNNGGACEDAAGNTLSSVVHAEVDAVNKFAFNADWTPGQDFDLANYTLYVSHQPCVECETKLKSVKLKYEVVSEFLKFDGDRLRYDLVPPSITSLIYHCCLVPDSENLLCVFESFEKYRELLAKDLPLARNALADAFLYLVSVVEPEDRAIHIEALKGIATILTFGARKYKPNNWRNCQELERYDAAFLRHYLAYIGGEANDADSGHSHLWHALTNLVFLLELRK